MAEHVIDPKVIRDLYDRGCRYGSKVDPRRRAAMIAHLFDRPENDIRRVLGLPLLAPHQIRPWMPVDEEIDEE